MLRRVLLLLFLLPFVEIVLLAMLADWLGWQVVASEVLLSALLGLFLLRHQGVRTVSRVRAQMETGEPPQDALLDGFFSFLAGVLLLLPGLATDIVAIVMLFPPTRRWIRRYWSRRWRIRSEYSRTVVEGTYVREAGDDEWKDQSRLP